MNEQQASQLGNGSIVRTSRDVYSTGGRFIPKGSTGTWTTYGAKMAVATFVIPRRSESRLPAAMRRMTTEAVPVTVPLDAVEPAR